MRYLIMVCLMLFMFIRSGFALKEVEYKKYIAFDGKVFDNRGEALCYEKIMSKVEILMKAFQEEIGNKKKQKLEDQDKDVYLWGDDPYRIKKYDDYQDLLFKCFKELDEQGYEVEIKLTRSVGSCTVFMTSSNKGE